MTGRRTDDWSSLDLLRDPTLHDDPYPTYAALRDQGPAVWSDALGGYWIVSRYDDISRILLDPKRFSNRRTNLEPGEGGASRLDFGRALLINSDDPEHAVHRKLVRPLFTPEMARSFEDTARRTMATLLEAATESARFEFVRDVAIPYIGEVFLPTMGLPAEDVPWLIERSWAEGMEPGRAAAAPNRDELAAAEKQVRAQIADYLRRLLASRREAVAPGAPDRDGPPPAPDLLDLLARARIDGQPVDEDTALNLLLVILNAGLHTTTNTLANMMVLLADHPAHRDRLVHQPELTGTAVEELMRYESIVTEGRIALEDVDLGDGVVVREGQFVALPFGSAGRDAEKFPQPDLVDFDRPPPSHLQFGLGIHRCIGMHLARMELRVALEEIHRRLPTYRRAAGTEPLRHTGQVRGTIELWLEH